MRRRLRAVAAGLMVMAAGSVATASVATAAFAAGSGPVATPPATPRTQAVTGVAVNGVQLSMTAPAQLPLDLPGRQLPEREVDITVKDTGGQGYTGVVSTSLTADGASAASATLRVDHYDLPSGTWQPQSVPAGGSFTVTDDVTVPAGGTQIVKLRLSPGTTVLDDVKASASANGASVVATMPVAGPSFQASGLTAGARAGASTVLTAKLTNPTDVDLSGIPVKLLLCPSGSNGCVAHASDVKVEVQTGGSWHPVTVAEATATSPLAATVLTGLTLPAASTAQFSVRVTIGAGAFGMSGAQAGPGTPGMSGQPSATSASSAPPQAQPMLVPLVLAPVGLTLTGPPVASGTLTVQPPPQPTPTTPSSTPSTAATSSAPTSTASSPTATDSPTGAATPTPTPAALVKTEAASTPGATSSGSPTILVAVGLLAVCLALLLWWGLMKRRERIALADSGSEDAPLGHDEAEQHGDGGQ